MAAENPVNIFPSKVFQRFLSEVIDSLRWNRNVQLLMIAIREMVFESELKSSGCWDESEYEFVQF